MGKIFSLFLCGINDDDQTTILYQESSSYSINTTKNSSSQFVSNGSQCCPLIKKYQNNKHHEFMKLTFPYRPAIGYNEVNKVNEANEPVHDNSYTKLDHQTTSCITPDLEDVLWDDWSFAGSTPSLIRTPSQNELEESELTITKSAIFGDIKHDITSFRSGFIAGGEINHEFASPTVYFQFSHVSSCGLYQ